MYLVPYYDITYALKWGRGVERIQIQEKSKPNIMTLYHVRPIKEAEWEIKLLTSGSVTRYLNHWTISSTSYWRVLGWGRHSCHIGLAHVLKCVCIRPSILYKTTLFRIFWRTVAFICYSKNNIGFCGTSGINKYYSSWPFMCCRLPHQMQSMVSFTVFTVWVERCSCWCKRAEKGKKYNGWSLIILISKHELGASTDFLCYINWLKIVMKAKQDKESRIE